MSDKYAFTRKPRHRWHVLERNDAGKASVCKCSRCGLIRRHVQGSRITATWELGEPGNVGPLVQPHAPPCEVGVKVWADKGKAVGEKRKPGRPRKSRVAVHQPAPVEPDEPAATIDAQDMPVAERMESDGEVETPVGEGLTGYEGEGLEDEG